MHIQIKHLVQGPQKFMCNALDQTYTLDGTMKILMVDKVIFHDRFCFSKFHRE